MILNYTPDRVDQPKCVIDVGCISQRRRNVQVQLELDLPVCILLTEVHQLIVNIKGRLPARVRRPLFCI